MSVLVTEVTPASPVIFMFSPIQDNTFLFGKRILNRIFNGGVVSIVIVWLREMPFGVQIPIEVQKIGFAETYHGTSPHISSNLKPLDSRARFFLYLRSSPFSVTRGQVSKISPAGLHIYGTIHSGITQLTTITHP